ncbi:helix-turn-helix domain-containing protein [Priestia megaterium]|uniref:helix-turn-helix domain-containing protein n=1 Tax=Priestia megaterium TaxID=1404 RepID=UPI00366A9644
MINHNFGRDIKALRTKRKIGSRELSRMIGKAETYISQLERGLIKKPDFITAYNIMKHLGWEEKNIEGFLDSFYHIKSPERIAAEEEQVIDWFETQYERRNETDYLENQFSYDIETLESKWMADLYKQLEKKNEEIKKELSFNIDTNVQTFESIVRNLHSFLTSMRENRENFDFFVGLFENDLTILSKESQEKILRIVKEEIKSTEGQ